MTLPALPDSGNRCCTENPLTDFGTSGAREGEEDPVMPDSCRGACTANPHQNFRPVDAVEGDGDRYTVLYGARYGEAVILVVGPVGNGLQARCSSAEQVQAANKATGPGVKYGE